MRGDVDLPQVTVITPTYNREHFLPGAIESVLAQTFRDFELILVDDGSVDNTRSVVEPFLADDRVRYFYQENQGQSYARNTALQKARGRFIAFLDSDDLWFPEKLEKQTAIFERCPWVDIVHGDEDMIDERGVVISRSNMRRYSGRITPHLLADNSVSITTAIVRRGCFDAMGGFDTRYGVADDYELWLRFSARYVFHYEPGAVAAYRVMQDQISSDKRRRFAANEKIISDFLARFGGCLSRAEKRAGLARFYVRKARYFAMAGDRLTASLAIGRALGFAPLGTAVWRGVYRVINPGRSDEHKG